MTRAVLVLEDGQVFTGRSYGADGSAFGEAVFSTGMTGYQETITDPSYCGQVVVQTAPHIGNTGWNDEDDESQQIWVSGYVVRDPARRPSNWRSTISLDDELRKQNVIGISDVDTRALTRHLREHGAMRVGIFSGTAAEQDIESLLSKVREVPEMSGASFSETVSTKQTYVVPAVGTKKFQVAALDLGIKSMTPHLMAQRGIEVHVLPATISAKIYQLQVQMASSFQMAPVIQQLHCTPSHLCKQLLTPSVHSLESVLVTKSWDAPLGLELTNFVMVIAE